MYNYPGMEAGIMNGDYQAAHSSAFRLDRALNFPENEVEVNRDPSPPRIDMSSYFRSCSSTSTTLRFLVATRTNPVEGLP